MAGRDTNIGIMKPINFKESVDIENFASVIAKLQDVEAELQESVEELKKIKTGTGLTLGLDLDEEAE